MYQGLFLTLIREEEERGSAAGHRAAIARYREALPCARLGADACANELAEER
jgi:hypothetical protein